MPLDPRKHDAGDYIDDFMKSDAPQFKGKSKEQIRKMAIAAYLDAKREKGMEEGKMNQMQVRRQDMAKLASLYSKAMKAMPGSPAQKKIKAQIDQYRRELGMNESVDEAVDADDTGGEEEVSMAMKQVQAMRHFLDGIEARVKEQGDMEEWYQNKLTKANDYLKTLYSYGKGDKVQEAVSPAQQAAIAISKKERGEKPKNEVEEDASNFKSAVARIKKARNAKDLKKLEVSFDRVHKVGALTNKELMRLDTMITDKLSKLGESRAYRDAMRGMKGNTKGMATTKKDKDSEASDDDRKAASKNIIMQLRKAADSMAGADIEFEKGKGKVSRSQAQNVLAKFNSLSKPRDKEQMQKSIRSLSDIKKILGR